MQQSAGNRRQPWMLFVESTARIIELCHVITYHIIYHNNYISFHSTTWLCGFFGIELGINLWLCLLLTWDPLWLNSMDTHEVGVLVVLGIIVEFLFNCLTVDIRNCMKLSTRRTYSSSSSSTSSSSSSSSNYNGETCISFLFGLFLEMSIEIVHVFALGVPILSLCITFSYDIMQAVNTR